MSKQHLPTFPRELLGTLKNLPIAGKLLLLTLVPLVLTLAATLALTITGLNRLEADTVATRLQQEERVIRQQFAQLEANLLISVARLVSDPALLDATERGDEVMVKGLLLATTVRSADLSYLQVMDIEGRTLGVKGNFEVGAVPPELDRFNRLGLIQIEATKLVPTAQGWLLVVVRPLKTSAGQVVGALSIGRLLDNTALFTLNFERTDPLLALFDAQGNLSAISTADAQSDLNNAFEIDLPLWTQAAQGQITRGQVSIQGEAYRVIYAPLVVGNETVAVFSLAASTAATTHLRDQLVTTNLMAVGVLALLGSLAALGLGRNFIVRPIAALVARAEQIKAGQLDVVVPGANSRDEIGQLAATFNDMAVQLRHTLAGLENYTQRLKIVAKLSGHFNAVLNLEELLVEVVNQIKDSFDYYHVQTYILAEDNTNDAGQSALIMRAGTGEAGATMKVQGHAISLNAPTSLVARAARTGEVILVGNVRQVEDWLSNPLLPDTCAEMAIPIIVEGQVVGVLDVHEDEVGGLDESDANLLRSLANQVAIAIANARLFEQTTQAREEAELAKEKADQAREETELANKTLERQIWQTTGQAQLNDKMQGEPDLPTLANGIMQQLCSYLQAQIGALYIVEDHTLELMGSYAYSSNKPATFKFGEGLVGQAALEKRPMFITDVPNDYITIRSGLGETAPRNIMVFPFMYNDRVIGAIEMGTLTEFTQAQYEFIQTALANIAIAFNTVQARARINELLARTQQQAEELQAQGEELRAANEELEIQTESLRASEAKLREKQSELESTNAQLEEQAAALEENSRVLQEKQAVLDRQNQELKTAQQDLEQKAEELALASKYKSEFLANMSHELRTPLNSLLILARILANNEEGNLSEEQVESAKIIYSGGNDLLNLINDILDLSKVESGQMVFHFEAMPLTELVSTVQTQFAQVAKEKGLDLHVNMAADLPGSIETDTQRVKQILKNLLSNAFKFTSAGSVSCNVYRPEAKINLSRSGLDPTRAIAISVVDTGIGMTPDQQKIIFEAFQQADGSTSRQYGGTGLGLSISRELANKLGGQINVESEKGQGSTFTLYLPIEKKAGEPARQPKVQPAAPERSNGHKPKHVSTQPALTPAAQSAFADDRASLKAGDKILLVIEDDSKFAKIVCDFAHKKGFKCLVAAEGSTGLALVKTHPPEAIILDLNLPDISGWEVLQILKSDHATRHIPVHIMSVDEEILDAYRKGALGYLTKPVSGEHLAESFQKIEQFMSKDIKSLLLVEDDANSRHSIKKLLGGSDVQISEADRGQTALDLLKTQNFDCMILDLSLPDMSGFEVLNRMNGHMVASKCPVIVYTGRELTPEENLELMKYTNSVIVKGVKSPERLLDETALFLHRVVADMPEDKQQTIRQLHNKDELLKNKKVLIVDDDMRNSFALAKLLSDKGLIIRIAQNGRKALDLLAEEPADLVLMDIMMPVMDGYETIRHIRAQQQFKTLPILALTAKAMKGDRDQCLAAGANDYLSKPIEVDRLFSMLQVWLYN